MSTVNLSSTPHCDASAEARSTIFQSTTTTPQGDGQPETVGRRSAVGDGVIPALLFD